MLCPGLVGTPLAVTHLGSNGKSSCWSSSCWSKEERAALFQQVARLWSASLCYNPYRWVTAARRAGADAETGGGEGGSELPALQLAGDDPASGRRLPAPAGDPGFQPAAVVQ